MNKSQQIQVELIAKGIGAMVESLKETNKLAKKNNSLADQFPVGASK